MSQVIPVYVYAADPISEAGTTAELRQRHEIRIVDEGDIGEAAVALVVADGVCEETVRVARALQRNSCPRVVLVVTDIDDRGLLAAVEAGVCGVVRREEANPAKLAAVVRTAAKGDGTIPSDLLGRLLQQIHDLQNDVLEPRGLNLTGLSDREVEVLRLVADGHNTDEIAERMAYSPRTVKNVIHGVTSRLHLKNRSHAVAYAMRAGLI